MWKTSVMMACLAATARHSLRANTSVQQELSIVARTSLSLVRVNSSSGQGHEARKLKPASWTGKLLLWLLSVLPAATSRRSMKTIHSEDGSSQLVETFQVAGMHLMFAEGNSRYTSAMARANSPLPDTGTFIWDAGVVLAKLLGDDPATAGKRIVELGSGTGIAGLSAAAAGAQVVLTDRHTSVAILDEHIALNRLESRAVASALQWGSPYESKEIKAQGTIDLICGSDLLYESENFDSLLRTLVDLSTPGKTEVLLTYPLRGEESAFFAAAAERFDKVETYKFQDGFEENGINVEEIWCTRLWLDKKNESQRGR